MSQQQPFVVPDIGSSIPPAPPIRVPDVISGESVVEIPDWTYKKFSVFDVFHSKIGVSATTAVLTFASLAYFNPPFVQQNGENDIEIRKPSLRSMYTISFVVFVLLMLVPVNPKPGSR
jgi:hypothetical protein